MKNYTVKQILLNDDDIDRYLKETKLWAFSPQMDTGAKKSN